MKKTKPPRKSKPKGVLTDEDHALWKAVTETVDPLPGRDALGGGLDMGAVLDDPLRLEDGRGPALKRIAAREKVVQTLAPPPKPLPELTHDAQPGLDKATAKRLRRGQVTIEARIDLHGMTQDEARPALEAFIESSWYRNLRQVLVITGKGTRADGTIGVLRQRVPQWLNMAPNRARVTAFSYAAPKDGGEGALYVRLKRRG